jgi:hypothetical protein
MDIAAIIETAVSTWHEESQCYRTESPLSETIAGHGSTPEESMQTFLDMLELNYRAYIKGKHALYPRTDNITDEQYQEYQGIAAKYDSRAKGRDK